MAGPASWEDQIVAEAKRQGVDPNLALAVAETESSFNPTARSPKGAYGLFQLMPQTAKRRGVDINDPAQNIRGGIGELKDLLAANKGDVTMALRRYNGSPQASEAATQPYVDRVTARMKGRAAGMGPQAGQPPPQVAGTGISTPIPPPSPPRRLPAPATALALPPESGFEGADTDFVDEPVQASPATGPAGGADFVDEPVSTPATAKPGYDYSGTDPEAAFASAAAPVVDKTLTFLGLDPRSPEGRRNLGGMTGAIVGGALAPETGGLSIILPAVGAALGGATVQGGEQAAHGEVPELGKAAVAGGEQAAYELGGRAILWPIRAVGRRLVSSRVARYASETLSKNKEALLTSLGDSFQAAQDLLRRTKTATRGAVSTTAEGARAAVRGAEETTARNVRVAEQEAGKRVAGAEAGAQAAAEASRQPYERMVGQPPPSAAAAGRTVAESLTSGPSKAARDLLGQAVEEAAMTGPAVDITALKAEAQRILENEIRPPAETFPRVASDAAIPGMEGVPQAAIERTMAGGGASAQALQEAMAAAQAAAGQDTLKHPAMQVLNRILNAADQVPFKDAHLFKRELDEAIGGAFDATVKKRVTNITKTLRGQLREALSVHEPYNRATAAYAQVAPLYTKGIAPKVRKLAAEDPEAVVRLLRPGQPTSAQMLHDVLVNQADLVGEGAAGQAAWDSVRSAWTRQNLIEGGMETLGKRLEKLDRTQAFRDVLFGDSSGKRVLDNLKSIDTAYRNALTTGEEAVARATEQGKAGVGAAKELGRQRVAETREAGHQAMATAREGRARAIEAGQQTVETARQALRQGKATSRAAQQAFESSRLGPLAKPGGARQAAGDALRAMALGPQRIWGAVSIARLMSGPTAGELVHWAALSPQGTQLLVKALTSKAPAMAVADVARLSGILGPTIDFAVGHDRTGVGAPPPRPSQVGQPPPAPSR